MLPGFLRVLCGKKSPMSIPDLEYTLRKHLTTSELEAGLDNIRRAPKDEGILELIVRRPVINEREILQEAELWWMLQLQTQTGR